MPRRWRLWKGFDWPLFVAMLLLLILGLTVLFSTNEEAAQQQVFFVGLGLTLYLLVSLADYRWWFHYSYIIYLATLLLLVIILLAGQGVRGSVRWLDLGVFNLQASELAKLALVLTLARLYSYPAERWLGVGRVFASVIILAPVAFLVFRQPDLGTTLVILGIWLGMTFFAGLKPTHLLLLVLSGGTASYPLWHLLKPYQQERLVTFLNPFLDPLGSGYHVLQSTIAVGSGQFWGRGFGRGTQSHLQFLPEYYTDFVFASFAEEWGFLGSLVMLGLFALLCWRILKIASQASEAFGALVCIGVLVMTVIQILINVGMNLGVMPITGITLPLISYGGSSLVTVLISLALVQSVARKREV